MSFFYTYVATLVVGTTASFIGAQKSADAQEKAGKLQQKAASQAARNEELQAAETVSRERVNKRRALARYRAMLAGQSGLSVEGSVLDAFTETAGRMEMEVQDIARAGAMNAANLRSQGETALWEARAGALGTRISSYGTLLSSASSLASTGYSNGWFGGTSQPAGGTNTTGGTASSGMTAVT